MDGQSLDITAEKIAQLRAILPEVFSEDKVDFARLKDVLGESVVFPNEHYELSWAGKAEARREIQKQTTATLIPDKENSVNFGATGNVFIEGENLEVLRVLQKSYFGKVKMIYIDPPYNTGNDSFVYPDDFAERQDEYNKRTGKTNGEGYLNKQDLWRKNSRENGQFHSVWLSMMYPRLYLGRNLLREDGVIFVSIDDNEQANLKQLMDEIFGEEHFIGLFPWRKRTAKSDVPFGVSQDYEWVLCYAKSNQFIAAVEGKGRKYYETPDLPTRPWRVHEMTTHRTATERPNSDFTITNPKTGAEYPVNPNAVWRVSKETYPKFLSENRIVFPGDYEFLNISKPVLRYFKDEDELKTGVRFGYVAASTNLPKEVGMTQDGTKDIGILFDDKIFPFPKPINLIKYFLMIANDRTNSLVLDFFAGSGTTAQAVLELNEEDGGTRQFICVQMPERLQETSESYKAGYRTIADICRTRIQKVVARLQATRGTELELNGGQQPLGFQAFRLAPSNFKQWRGDVTGVTAILQQLEAFRHSEKESSEGEKMLYELLLKAGYSLTAKVEAAVIDEQALYIVEDSKMLVFFDEYTPAINDHVHQQKPQRVVCLDRVFKGNDEAVTNFKLQLREAGIELTII